MTGRRRVGGWGFEGEAFPPSPQLLVWLEAKVGRGSGMPPFEATAAASPPVIRLPELGIPLATDPLERLAHSRGQGLTDLLRLRSGTVPRLPAGVGRPRTGEEIESVLAACARDGIRVVPWGGGTSVTGGLNLPPEGPPVVVLDLERMSGLLDLDPASGLATFGAGAAGPQVESALAASGLTLGHFPQSWELSTVGGWVATRASGQESLGYGGISELVAGLEVVAPEGRLEIAPQPASAAGPDLRQLILGSEGRLGVITRATLRVRRRPQRVEVRAALLSGWESGLDAVRALVQEGVPLSLLRLSDATESEVALAVGVAGKPLVARLLSGYLTVRGLADGFCLLLYGAAGNEAALWHDHGAAEEILARFRALRLGSGPGRHWLADRFRHPYLRDALLDLGWGTETLETAAPWSRIRSLATAVRSGLQEALAGSGERVAVLCHVSHPYPDGASLYFTFFSRLAAEVEESIARWATCKRAANEAILAHGGTISHHHGVGSWHAPWYRREVGPVGEAALTAAARALDPNGILNPQALFTAQERLEI